MEVYVVGFKIFDAKALQTEDGLPCDPFVVVQSCGKEFQTKTQEQRQQLASFNEDCTWPNVELHPKQFESAFIEFKIFARNWFTRNYLIGKASLQLSFVNKRANCLYARKWLCLRRDEDPGITGMLNVTVFVLKPGQQAPSATLQEQEQTEAIGEAGAQEEEDKLSKAVLKTTVEAPAGRAHHVEINIHRVVDLPTTAGMMGEVAPSPYVTVEFSGVILKTPVIENVAHATLNARVLIPVVTPLYEDTIILKLWNSFTLSADELLAQGLISFSELRNNSLPPSWFNLYGYKASEISDPAVLTQGGHTPETNFFRGRMLVSGRVEPLAEGEQMQPASVGVARPVPEPNVNYVCLLADVYMVIGAEGRTCEVELSFGATTALTESVAGQYKTSNEGGLEDQDGTEQQDVSVSTFTFNQAKGRIAPMLVMAPEEAQSQPYVMINVYTTTYLGGRRRVGFCKRRLADFASYDSGNPSKPTFFPLTPLPGEKHSSTASILMTIEQSTSDDIPRHTRKEVKPMMYIIRSYCFLARNIEAEGHSQSNYSLRVTCAGHHASTKALPGPRPKWMEFLNLQATLYSDSAKEPPVIEPIQLHLRNTDTGESIGHATCIYTRMRQKDNLGHWQPYHLAPQWIKVRGGPHGNSHVGDVLICFEILLHKYQREAKLLPQIMMPQPRGIYDPKIHFCELRKATLHFSLLGLRDLLPINRFETSSVGGKVDVVMPIVEVEVAWGDTIRDPNRKRDRLEFHYKEVVDGGDKRIKADCLKNWKSKVGAYGEVSATNFEFLQVKTLEVEIPDQRILQPCVIIRVYEAPTRLSNWVKSSMESIGMDYKPFLIGESRRTLGASLPVCWLQGVDLRKTLADQKDKVESEFAAWTKEARLHENFNQDVEDTSREQRRRQEESSGPAVSGGLAAALRDLDAAPEEYVSSTALPMPLRNTTKKRKLNLRKVEGMNVQVEGCHSPRQGEKAQVVGQHQVKTIQGKLEDDKDKSFVSDFWYRATPLLLNHDLVDGMNSAQRDWYFMPNVFGFVKCAFKLVDGWESDLRKEEEVEAAGGKDAQASVARTASGRDQISSALRASCDHRLLQSYYITDELDSFAFNEKKFQERFKNPERMPSRVRVRLYLVKAVCIFGKGANDFPDPYVMFQLGHNISVSFKSQVRIGTNEPSLYMLEERDVVLPDDGKLEVRLMDKVGAVAGDALIGSTILDLEDRWFSTNWRKCNDHQEVPRENRPLSTLEVPGKNRGSIEMWVEMIESQRAADLRASPLVKPAELEVELRLVIWDTIKVKLVKEDYVNVKIISTLDCNQYCGNKPTQETDVHYTSKDGSAIFNWRLVYSRIKMPVKTCSLKMDLMHYELLGDTYIGSLNLDLKKYVERVATTLDAVEVPADFLKFSNADSEDPDNPEEIGSVRVQLYVMTQGEAGSKAAGLGREDPNEHPPLIQPAEGRDWGTYLAAYSFSLPDFSMWKKFLPIFIAMVVFLVAIVGMKNLGLV